MRKEHPNLYAKLLEIFKATEPKLLEEEENELQKAREHSKKKSVSKRRRSSVSRRRSSKGGSNSMLSGGGTPKGAEAGREGSLKGSPSVQKTEKGENGREVEEKEQLPIDLRTLQQIRYVVGVVVLLACQVTFVYLCGANREMRE